MNNQSFNPLDPDNIRHSMSDSEKRVFKRKRIYPWYATTAAALLFAGFLGVNWLQESPPLPPIPPVCEAHPVMGCFEGPPPPPPPPKVRPLIEPRVQVPEALIHQLLEPLHEEIEPEEWPSVWSCDFPAEEEEELLYAPLEELDYDWEEFPEPFHDQNGDPLIDAFIFADEEPKPLNLFKIISQIQYPQIVKDTGFESLIAFRILVDKEGLYVRHEAINQVHPALAAQVEKYIPELRFTPAIQNGKPIRFWVNVPFRFEPLD